MKKLKTLTTTLKEEEEDDHQIKVSFPNEIIQDILSRFPVKPILQFRSVSKQWRYLISGDPCFRKLHFTRSLVTNDRTSFFVSAHDTATNERHLLSAPHDGGPVTHLITLHNVPRCYDDTEAEHLNGLVFFASRDASFNVNFAFVVNPATRKVIKVPPPFSSKLSKYFFGFDESNTMHKILSINFASHNAEFMIFSLPTYSWRKIPVDLKELPPVSDMICSIKHSVCVNSVIHLMLHERYKILAFDLTTEKFSIINLPQGAIPRKKMTEFLRRGQPALKFNEPFLIKDNDLLGVVCHDLVVEINKMHIWILRDYVSRVWVRETITFFKSWIELDGYWFFHMRHHMFSCRRLSRDMVDAFILDMKSKSFKLVDFNLGYRFLHSTTVKFHQIRSYVECILPLRE